MSEIPQEAEPTEPVDELRLEEPDFSFNGNAGIEDMGRDLLAPVESEESPVAEPVPVSAEERRAEAVNIATTLPNGSVSELLSAAYEIEEYLVSGRRGDVRGIGATE